MPTDQDLAGCRSCRRYLYLKPKKKYVLNVEAELNFSICMYLYYFISEVILLLVISSSQHASTFFCHFSIMGLAHALMYGLSVYFSYIDMTRYNLWACN